MLTLTQEKHSTCFKFIGANSAPQTTHLISDNTSLISSDCESCFDTCSFYSGPSDAAILAFGESSESCGSIAFGGYEYSSVSGSGASVSVASSGGFSGCSVGGGCSYSC